MGVTEHQQSVMVALLPTDGSWCQQDLPHCTLVYAGEIPNLNPYLHSRLKEAALVMSLSTNAFTTKVSGVGVLGDEKAVWVMHLEDHPTLTWLRMMVSHHSASKFPFRPHCTIGEVGTAYVNVSNIPEEVTFDRLLVAWGENRTVYPLQPERR